MAETDAPLPPPARCSLCRHPWSAHFGGGPHAVWATCCAEPDQPWPAGPAGQGGAGDGDVAAHDDDAANAQMARPDGDGGPLLAERIAASGGAVLPAVAGLTGPAPVCYCRRSLDDFRHEALGAARAGRPAAVDGDGHPEDDGTRPSPGPVPSGTPAAAVVLCVTCGAAPAEDTQCRPCRQARQQAARARFAVRQSQLARDARRHARGR